MSVEIAGEVAVRHGERARRDATGWLRRLAYGPYARRLRKQVRSGPLPEHVAVVVDGNRRWARAAGLPSPSLGHKYGAEHVEHLLLWCQRACVKNVTVYLCSTENLERRDSDEVAFLMQLIEEMAVRLHAENSTWRVHLAGRVDLLPPTTAGALTSAVEARSQCDSGANLTLAIGYGGRQELIDAIRAVLLERAQDGQTLTEAAEEIGPDDIARHLYTAGLPDPDLIIRTSGELRMSNFFLWQSAYSELYFCDAYWPAFREIDLLRAIRSYAGRHRRYGA
jgi:short-chain Z-isoprenyl diphosphate synthase